MQMRHLSGTFAYRGEGSHNVCDRVPSNEENH